MFQDSLTCSGTLYWSRAVRQQSRPGWNALNMLLWPSLGWIFALASISAQLAKTRQMRCNGKDDFRQATERCTGGVRSHWSGGYRGCGWLVVLGKLALLAKPCVQRFLRPFLRIAANVKLIEIARSGGALENEGKYRRRCFLRDSFSNLGDCCWLVSKWM